MGFEQVNFDLDSEKAIISGLINEDGYKLWTEISDIVTPNTFVADTHQVVYKCINAIFKEHSDISKLNFPLLLSTSKTLGFGEFLDNKEEKKYLKEVVKIPCEANCGRLLAIKLRKLEFIRVIREQLAIADSVYSKSTGEEKLLDLLGVIEKPVLDLSQLVYGLDNNGPKAMFEDAEQFVQERLDNPVEVVGIDSGWPLYNQAIGGGLRHGTVNVIASRFGEGKSSIADNMGYYVGSQGIPVLILDTEMSRQERLARVIAMVSGVTITEVEKGNYGAVQDKVDRAKAAATKLKTLPVDYENICGLEFDQIVAIMRNWVFKKVGLTNEGVAKPCLVILDYLKLQSTSDISKNVAEYMLLGMLTTAFVNFCQKYKVAGLTFAQINREGINSEESSVIAGSDRISWFASSVTLMKSQNEEEIQAQKDLGLKKLYNRKLVFIKTRHGPGADKANYINLDFQREICRMTEGPHQFDLTNSVNVINNMPIVTRDSPNKPVF